MHPVIQKTLGGLTRKYYFRQLFFGVLFAAFAWLVVARAAQRLPLDALPFFAIHSLLYPYARFAYESAVRFVMGENLLVVNAIVMMLMKCLTIALCWGSAMVLAPIGLACLYLRHSKSEAG